jgi:adenylate kinase family enzyme
VQREDDKEANVRARLKNYRSYTAPLLDYYRAAGILKTVSAPTSHEGYVEIRKILDAHKQAIRG